MSKKILLDEKTKKSIIDFVKSTYQCTISDVEKEFGINRDVIRRNIDKNYLESILFHGCKDTTKAKLRELNLGKTQSEETIQKRTQKTQAAWASKSKEEKRAIAERALHTKAEHYGSIQEYYNYQVSKSKQTKLERYGDENYNNIEKNQKTKLDRYGDCNYNNQSQIRETQFKLYGRYAFENREKYEKTMLERYEVKHNWSSSDPALNGRKTMYKNAGSKEQHYINVFEKGRQTRKELYGDEFYSNSEKAQQTMLEKYKVPHYCMSEDCQSKCHTVDAELKKTNTKRKNNTFHQSIPEKEVKQLLIEKFGEDNILSEYQDSRYSNKEGYSFKCDFYVSSIDLFIELNLHPTHYNHPFNKNDKEDLRVLEILRSNPTTWNKTTIDVWTIRDVEKQQVAKQNDLNYIVIYPGDNYYDIIQRI